MKYKAKNTHVPHYEAYDRHSYKAPHFLIWHYMKMNG
jgi:hypothetical protein